MCGQHRYKEVTLITSSQTEDYNLQTLTELIHTVAKLQIRLQYC